MAVAGRRYAVEGKGYSTHGHRPAPPVQAQIPGLSFKHMPVTGVQLEAQVRTDQALW